MIAELADDNKTLAARLREAHNVCDEHRDIATASLIEVWIDETERRTWFLFEITRGRIDFRVQTTAITSDELQTSGKIRITCFGVLSGHHDVRHRMGVGLGQGRSAKSL